ncbi:MAG: hypothetical protein SOT64_05565 [Candidatus Faecousia sp.]|nr:hypothetical protein [Clostridiales bacterium]MDY2810066.1 hypothetical protein [Candidatus Faecousia sp.]
MGEFIGTIILTAFCFAGGAVFFGIGVYAGRKKGPMNFWAGEQIAPESVTDIPAYNRQNAVMWKWYSLSYFLTGLCALLSIWSRGWNYICLGTLVLGCCGGMIAVICRYRNIRRKYLAS